MPPLVAVNAKYYGWRVALYIAAVMYVSMVSTALLLHLGFGALGVTPESRRVVEEATRFSIDYTFWLNLLMVCVAGWLVWLHRRRLSVDGGEGGMEMPGGGPVKRGVAIVAAATLMLGAGLWWGGLAG